jgi:hypothetical protein
MWCSPRRLDWPEGQTWGVPRPALVDGRPARFGGRSGGTLGAESLSFGAVAAATPYPSLGTLPDPVVGDVLYADLGDPTSVVAMVLGYGRLALDQAGAAHNREETT